ncbi:origin of replication complex subunit 3-like [Aristolochia californica]|uniref:origin of replication complex subunit 3-like n=1 Tax=Aristolochia californica TaxID=171875 RepID=UPI0035D8B916
MVGDGNKLLKPQRPNNHGTSQPRSHLNVEIASSTANEMAATLLESMIRNYLKPMECMPFHEIVCFKHVNILLSALIGDPRRTVQVDLLKSHTYLHCSCCHKAGNALLPTTHDTSIMYHLAQEQGDLINLHDWYQSFKGIILSSGIKGKKKVVQSPVSRKRKATNATLNISEASIQARFCRAVTELQITGLLRMPSKRRPDFVQRVAFGL